ncbi:MAG: hypothetical protein BA066_01395 [Candidatus Korarchaeota archaeon NZ13-K]|nr:MAG: hypothetical protein BA066_01395 [Candidatus Korarchaeota archaeon NZ13-K]
MNFLPLTIVSSRVTLSLRLYSEGRVSFYSTDLEELERRGIPYTKAPVFYNPRMKLNRDLSVTVFSSLNLRSAADLMAASGVRALRLRLEGGADEVIACDSNCLSVQVMRINVRLNRATGIRVRCSDARLEAERMAWEGERVDYLDLDPFGSPAPFIDSSLRAVRGGGILGVTATDEPPLFGIYPKKLFRYYGVSGRKLPFCKEFGIRALISFVVRTAARLDLAAEPLLSYGEAHYIRAYFRIERGASRAQRLLGQLGWLAQRDGGFELMRGVDELPGSGGWMGPVWLGGLVSKDFLDELKPINEEVENLVERLREEADGPPFYYKLDDICSELNIRIPKISIVIESLREMGHFAARSHLDPLGVKTTASKSELEDLLRKLTSS